MRFTTDDVTTPLTWGFSGCDTAGGNVYRKRTPVHRERRQVSGHGFRSRAWKRACGAKTFAASNMTTRR